MNLSSNLLYLLSPLASVFVTVVLAIVIFRGTNRSKSTLIFYIILLSVALIGMATFGLRASPDLQQALLWGKAMMWTGMAMYVLFYHFSLAYTNSKGQRGILIASYSFLLIVTILTPTSLLIERMRLEYYGYAPVIGSAAIPASIVALCLIGGGTYNLLKRYRVSPRHEEKNRILYLIAGIGATVTGIAIDATTNLPPFGHWGYIVFCTLCTIAIVKYHLLDVRVIIRKSLAFLIISAVIAIPYVAILLILGQFLEARTEQWWVHTLIILLLAILLRPLYTWTQQLVDKLFYRDRYDYLRALQQFTRETQSIMDSKKIGSTLIKLVEGAFKNSSTCFLLPSGSNGDFVVDACIGVDNPSSGVVMRGNSRLAKWLKLHGRTLSSRELEFIPQLQSIAGIERGNLEKMGAELCVPIRTREGNLSGVLILGQKLSQQAYSAEEKELLITVASQIAMVLDNARLYEETKGAEENFRNSLDNSPLGIRIIRAEGELLYANQAILDTYSYSSIKELKDTPTQKRYTPESYAEHQERKQKRKLGKPVPSNYEVSIVRKDGEVRYLLVSRKEVVWDGEVQFQVLYQDITERKQAIEDFENIFNLSPDMVGVFTTDGKLIKINPSWERILGYKIEELLNMGWTKLVHPGDVERTNKEVEKQLKGSPVVDFINRYKCKDGSNKTLEWRATFAKKGIVYATARDITERKQAEEKLKQAAEKWETTFASITDMISIQDKDCKLVMVNKAYADAIKMGQRELIGKTCYEVLHHTKEPWPNCPHKKTLETAKPTTVEFFEPHLGIHLQVTTSPIFDEEGEVASSVHIARDVTERRQAEEGLREAETLRGLERLRNHLLANVSHDLRTPLAAIKGYSTLLLKYGPKLRDDQRQESLESIDEATDRLTNLVDQILDMSQLESGMVEMDKQFTNIPEMVMKVIDNTKVWAPNYRIESKFDETLPEVNIDADRIQQVLNNLIENAVKYSPEGTAIVIEARGTDSELVFSIADQGMGISVKELKRVFDRMYRVERRVAPETRSGAGLGLAICKALVEAHGGRIWAESKIGKGSTFYFTLPKQTIAKGHGNGKKA